MALELRVRLYGFPHEHENTVRRGLIAIREKLQQLHTVEQDRGHIIPLEVFIPYTTGIQVQ